jgi:hypothetical protein
MLGERVEMNVKELREKLARLDDKADVYIAWEDGNDSRFFGIDDVNLQSGTPRRHANGKVGFTWDRSGPVEWAFISVSEE